MSAAALDDRFLEQTLGLRRRQQVQHAGAAGRFTEHGDIVRITAERGDVRFHPTERRDLIHQTVVAACVLRIRRSQRRVREETEPAEPIVQRHQHDAALREARTVVDRHRTGTQTERTAMYPHHHRTLSVERLSPDVQEQTTLVGGADVARAIAARRLRTRGAVMRRVVRFRPRLHRLRRTPSQRADRRCRIGNALEREHAVLAGAHDRTGAGCDHWRGPANERSSGTRQRNK